MTERGTEREEHPLQAATPPAPSAPAEDPMPAYQQHIIVQQPIKSSANEMDQNLLLNQDQDTGNYDKVPLNKEIKRPSQDQIAAVFPQFDDDSDPSPPPQDGIGFVEGCKQVPNLLTWFLTLVMWILLVLSAWGSYKCNDQWEGCFIAACVLYVISLCETASSQVRKYLSGLLCKEEATALIEGLRRAHIEIWWTVKCYHNETRMRIVNDKDSRGQTRTKCEMYQEKVYTWSATQQFQYALCADVSGAIRGLGENKITRLRLHKAYQFADDATRAQYINAQEAFKRNNCRDDLQEFAEETRINEFTERMLTESEPGVKPPWMESSVFWWFSIFGMSPCYRLAFVAQCGNIDFAIVKQISCLNQH